MKTIWTVIKLFTMFIIIVISAIVYTPIGFFKGFWLASKKELQKTK